MGEEITLNSSDFNRIGMTPEGPNINPFVWIVQSVLVSSLKAYFKAF